MSRGPSDGIQKWFRVTSSLQALNLTIQCPITRIHALKQLGGNPQNQDSLTISPRGSSDYCYYSYYSIIPNYYRFSFGEGCCQGSIDVLRQLEYGMSMMQPQPKACSSFGWSRTHSLNSRIASPKPGSRSSGHQGNDANQPHKARFVRSG